MVHLYIPIILLDIKHFSFLPQGPRIWQADLWSRYTRIIGMLFFNPFPVSVPYMRHSCCISKTIHHINLKKKNTGKRRPRSIRFSYVGTCSYAGNLSATGGRSERLPPPSNDAAAHCKHLAMKGLCLNSFTFWVLSSFPPRLHASFLFSNLIWLKCLELSCIYKCI